MSNSVHLIVNDPKSKISKSWYAIYVRSRHEKAVHAELQKKGIESSLPLIYVIRQWSDRKKRMKVPLFRGYIFVKIDFKNEKISVLATTGVVKFIMFNKIPVPIPKEQMYWLTQVIGADLLLSQEQNFPIGTEVDVMSGPLKGLRGRIKQKNSNTRLVVWLDVIMQGVSVVIDPANLLPVLKHDKSFQPKYRKNYIM